MASDLRNDSSDSEEVIFSSDSSGSEDDYSVSSSDNTESDDELIFENFDEEGYHPQQFELYLEDQPNICNDNDEPIDFFRLFLDNALLDIIVNETNKNAEKIIASSQLLRQSRLKNWIPTNKEEIEHFFSLILYIGLVKYPKISDYWSRKKLYSNDFAKTVMSRNRFQLLLRMIHFADDSESPNDRLRKIRNVLEYIQMKFKSARSPGEEIVIDESMVPWRGRLIFRQYNPGKRHRYGVKLYKLCGTDGYTYSVLVYAGRNSLHNREGHLHSTQVVLQLAEYYLNTGRTLTTDNFYTSIELAKLLISKNTHLVGTLRRNRKGVPNAVSKKKLSKGEFFGMKDINTGIVISKWKDKRDVMMLSTKHGMDTVDVTDKRGRNKTKPSVIIDYNSSKQGIDLSDQMASYFSPLRRTIRWYHKVVFEILLNTAVVNAYLLFKTKTGKEIQIGEFRERLILSLSKTSEVPSTLRGGSSKHQFKETEEIDSRNRKRRRRCSSCYSNLLKEGGRSLASSQAKRESTYCANCENQPAFCRQNVYFQTHLIELPFTCRMFSKHFACFTFES